MAGIRSLGVRGIRSFGPEDNDEQRIAFERPLTLILGQNGCGKTTIIESLRYAITGQMPPGSRNECFVHDTKINRSTEVLAQVKLKIVNSKDKQLEVARSMKVTALPNKKSKFQTLDSFLSVIDESGKPKDISSRCADLDSMIQTELGVSKAIINSVVLCHQEDSAWPLDEGKKVKERFDEIFDAEKYSECFDKLRKVRKEYTITIKMLSQEVEHLTEMKHELDKKKLEMVNTESRISEDELKLADLTRELTPISEKIKAIVQLQKNLVAYETKKEKMKTRLEHCKTQEEELTKAIKTLYEGETEALQSEINNHGTTAKAKKKELDESHKKIFRFNKEEENMANEMSSNEAKVSKLQLLESQNQERLDKRNKMIVETAQLGDIVMAEIETNEAAVDGVKTVMDKIKELQADLKEQRSTADAEERTLQLAVDECRDALTRHKQMIVSKEGEITKVKKDITKKKKEIDDANESKIKLEALEAKLSTAEKEHETVAAEVNQEETQAEINIDEKNLEKSEEDLKILDAKITKLQKQSTKLKERDMIQEQFNSKEKQLSVLQNKHRPALMELLGDLPEKNYAMSVKKVEVENASQVDAIKKKLKEKQTELTRAEANRKNFREQLTDKRSELTAAEDRMYKACGTQTYEATLAKLNTTVEKLQEEHSLLQSTVYVANRYKEQLKENNSCPLCSRGFDAQNEVSDLIQELETKVMNIPAKLEKTSEELQKASAKKDDLLGLKTLNEKITQLKEKDIPQLETRTSDADKTIAQLTEIIEECNTTIVEPERKLKSAKQIHGECKLLDVYTHEMATITKNLDKIKETCSSFDTDLTLDDATAQQATLRTTVTALRVKLKTAQNKLNVHNKKLQKLVDAKNKLKEQMLNMQKKVQELCNLQEALTQFEENLVKYEAELVELKAGQEPLDVQLKEKQQIKADAVAKNRATIDTKRAYIAKIDSSFDKVKSIIKEIKQHEEKNVQREMEKIQEANEKIMEKKIQAMKDRDEITKRIEVLKDELAKQEIYKRDLDDNLKLRKAQTEAATLTKDLADVEEKMSGVDTESLNEKEPLMAREHQLFKEKMTTEGRLDELKSRLKYSKVELMKSQNKNIEQKYREKFYELLITRAMDKDLKDYSIALEKCVMEFHREKMENINLIIREMWRKIYRGNDIDYIEIKTESSMTGDGDRRKYDYRVIQCKNGVEIDMRGRCSAGQKVLACLIIRLALAETFSSRFGILALDEPTTNLDQENIRSLCTALGEIVQERMRQKNFMFIIITHDKEFIESLGNIDKVTHYYEVSRNDDGKSRIKKIRFT